MRTQNPDPMGPPEQEGSCSKGTGPPPEETARFGHAFVSPRPSDQSGVQGGERFLAAHSSAGTIIFSKTESPGRSMGSVFSRL